jgi:hypothetical protein
MNDANDGFGCVLKSERNLDPLKVSVFVRRTVQRWLSHSVNSCVLCRGKWRLRQEDVVKHTASPYIIVFFVFPSLYVSGGGGI